MKNKIVYAHRGASRYAPENTLAAFRKTYEMGAHGIELDTHLTNDGFLVVTHDDLLGRTCNGKGMVKDHSLKELRELDFGGWFSKDFAGERIPLLSEVIELILDKKMILNVEIKATPERYIQGIDKKVADLIREYDASESIIISSFNHYILLKVKEALPEIVTAPLYSGLFADVWKYAGSIGAGAIHPHFSDITPEVVRGCKENNILINVWTIDEEADIKRAAELGVDGIISNVPDVALKVLRGLN